METPIVDTPSLDLPKKIKHPKELYRFSLATSWHMFAYYGTTAILLAYMVTKLHFSDDKGYAIFGTFSALAFGLPLFCGIVADKILGKRNSLIFGSLLQTIGLFCVAMPYPALFFTGLSFYVVGNGFTVGMIKALPGDFYHPDDLESKDSAYTIMYGLFNIGVAVGAIVCGYVGQQINWQLAFGIAAVGSVFSLLGMIFRIHKKYGQPAAAAAKKILPGINGATLTYILCLPAIALITLIFLHPGIMDVVLFPLAGVSFIYVIYVSFKYTRAERFKLFSALVAFTAYALFLALYEQSGGSFNLFVIRNMDMHVGNVLLPGLAINNFLTGFLPAIMMPLMLWIWRKLNNVGFEPGTILKFVIGFLFMGAFFGSFWWGCILYKSTGLVPVYFLFGGYILMEFSELCIGPIMYSLSYKLSPANIVGAMMGVLGIASALGEYLAAKIGSLATVPENIHNPILSLPYYTKIYGELALLSIGAAVFFALLIPLLKKWMQEVK
ncbi:oligopeptide:H+ symporter [Mucilaginibacter sp. dw_454]|uniref:peptide MFS transporter n=1 Tax=Mucilaginibacter sp. dw_454 TaxID=2720079 RepID=UPI001BD6191A|nr:oligopeptide:H+ symporter [Mucilaginibacter sp. dw_454]